MTREHKNCLWGLAAGLSPITMLLGPLIVRPLGGTENLSVAVGVGLALLFLSIYIPLVAQIETKESDRVASDETPATTPADPELSRQVKDIVNSGSEPALIVEELRRLTETKP